MRRIHKSRARQQTDQRGPDVQSEVNKAEHDLASELDDILDEIDSVLEENAEEFVQAYVQKGGE